MRSRQQRKRSGERVASARARAQSHQSGFERTCYKIPEGVETFTLKEAGVVRLDIMAYRAGEGNPYAEPGALWYERTWYRHSMKVGSNFRSYVCPERTFGKSCPVCEYHEQVRNDPDVDRNVAGALRAQDRQLFWVIDLDDPKKQLRLWDISHWCFGKALDARIRDQDEDEDFDTFFLPDQGYSLRCQSTKQEGIGGGKPFYKIEQIEFRERSKQYDRERMLKRTHCFEDMLIETSYNQLKSFLFNEGEEEEGKELSKGDVVQFLHPDEDVEVRGKVVAVKGSRVKVRTHDGERLVIGTKDIL